MAWSESHGSCNTSPPKDLLVQLLHILYEVAFGLIDIGKESDDACEGILDVLGKVGPLLLIRLEFLLNNDQP